ncbi:hypothetical protein H6G06_12505 [Anabaena sphaerica FACHB-251]|uniref:Co-chaperone DjlA N-terminal domain-containing protein n=1 Tax=Anabaena sphaerica FACHB-251 TaxID=2692883 RepID=A0A927A165_9NOST|nr:hypothetical protein [Anabaena sphaerica]MBD2294289.1 hypothetical protein [Anabaena sphaerica FACHB-251]
MQNFFQKLLQLPSGEWNQIQKEALIDLCLLGMYSDDRISLAEQDFIEDEYTQLKWESGISFSGYLQRTIPKIRSVKNNSQKTNELLQDIANRLQDDKLKSQAVAELEKLLSTDGIINLEEKFLSKVKTVMGI